MEGISHLPSQNIDFHALLLSQRLFYSLDYSFPTTWFCFHYSTEMAPVSPINLPQPTSHMPSQLHWALLWLLQPEMFALLCFSTTRHRCFFSFLSGDFLLVTLVGSNSAVCCPRPPFPLALHQLLQGNLIHSPGFNHHSFARDSQLSLCSSVKSLPLFSSA